MQKSELSDNAHMSSDDAKRNFRTGFWCNGKLVPDFDLHCNFLQKQVKRAKVSLRYKLAFASRVGELAYLQFMLLKNKSGTDLSTCLNVEK